IYIVVQLAGGVLGALLTKGILTHYLAAKAVHYGAPGVSQTLLAHNLGLGMLVEGVGTFFLIWAVVGVAVNPSGLREWTGRVVRAAFVCCVCALALAPRALADPNPFGSLTESGCFDPTKPNADYEAYGPTDVNVQAGNGRVTVGENSAGTITVFKYPNPSFYNQVKYLAVDRDPGGRARAQFPNEGSFAGLSYRTASGWHF